MEDHELAYLAGVIDTQAIIRTRTYKETVLPWVGIHGGNPYMLTRLGRLTGTKVTLVKRRFSKAGCMEHCPEQHVHVMSESGRWSVSGAKATVLLSALRPYLLIQGYAADTAIEIGMRAPRKPATAQKMVELGWPVPDGWLLGGQEEGLSERDVV